MKFSPWASVFALLCVLMFAVSCGTASQPPAASERLTSAVRTSVSELRADVGIQAGPFTLLTLDAAGKQVPASASGVTAAPAMVGDGRAVIVSAPASASPSPVFAYLKYDAAAVHPTDVRRGAYADDRYLFLAVTTVPGIVGIGAAPVTEGGPQGAGVVATVFYEAGAASSKSVAVVPRGASGAVTDLAVTQGSGYNAVLTWTEVNAGDYDNSGEVNIADLQPVAAYYMSVPTGPNDPSYMADGDKSGEVNITDLQPIANNFMNYLSGYTIYRAPYSGSPPDFTGLGHLPNLGTPPVNTNVSIDRPASPPTHPHLTYTYTDDVASTGEYAYIVRAYSRSGDTPPEGDPSNLGTVTLAPAAQYTLASYDASMNPATTFSIGDQIIIEVQVNFVLDLFTANARIEYPAGSLTFVQGVASLDPTHQNMLYNPPDGDPVFGCVEVQPGLAAFDASLRAGATGKNGSGSVAYITFTAAASGPAHVDILDPTNPANAPYVYLHNTAGNDIPFILGPQVDLTIN
jgi:hypothetical protein